MSRGESLILIGASVRAAAGSALRAGLRPWCVDLFADADLVAMCPARRLEGRYPWGFVEAMRDAPPGPWMYTGGLENYPRLVDHLAAARPVWGNGGEVLRRARDPRVLATAARSVGLPAPAQGLGHGRWLVKPRGGSGGAGIRFWSDGERVGKGDYCQEYVEGPSVSAVYVALGDKARGASRGTGAARPDVSRPPSARASGFDGGATLLGMTRQLVGERFLNALAFRYCGSIGPLAVPLPLTAKLQALGDLLVERLGLRGLFGIDGVLQDGDFWPVELNPRYTASVEVLERATGLLALDWHRRAFATATASEGQAGSSPYVGKAVLYARRSFTFPAAWPASPDFADLPHPRQPIEAGHPILSLFVTAAAADACLAALRQTAASVERRLYDTG